MSKVSIVMPAGASSTAAAARLVERFLAQAAGDAQDADRIRHVRFLDGCVALDRPATTANEEGQGLVKRAKVMTFAAWPRRDQVRGGWTRRGSTFTPVLSGEVPLLRLQQPCGAPGRRGALARALVAEIDAMPTSSARGGSPRFFGGGTPFLMAPATVAAVIERASAASRPRTTSRSPRGEPDLGRGGASRGLPQAGVNRVRWGSRRWTTPRCAFSAAARRRRGARRGRTSRDPFRALLFDLMCWPPGADFRGLASRSTRARPCWGPSQRLPADDRARHALALLERSGALRCRTTYCRRTSTR